eukprot:m.293695 g.293695  ORF g.293695 m.293695 type:complete len:912 (-) comp20023_c0_seq1:25-2760(-)
MSEDGTDPVPSMSLKSKATDEKNNEQPVSKTSSEEVDDDEKAFWGELAAFRRSQDEASWLLQATAEAIRTSEYCAQSPLHDDPTEYSQTSAQSDRQLSAIQRQSIRSDADVRGYPSDGYTGSDQGSMFDDGQEDAFSIASAPADISWDKSSLQNRVQESASHFHRTCDPHPGDSDSNFCDRCISRDRHGVANGHMGFRGDAGCDRCEECRCDDPPSDKISRNGLVSAHASAMQPPQHVAMSPVIQDDGTSSWKQSLRLDALETSSTALRQQALLLKYSSEELRAENVSLKRKLLQQYNVQVGGAAIGQQDVTTSTTTGDGDDTLFGDSTMDASMLESQEQPGSYTTHMSPSALAGATGHADNSALREDELVTQSNALLRSSSTNVCDSPSKMTQSTQQDMSAISARNDMEQIMEHCKRLLDDVEQHRLSLSMSPSDVASRFAHSSDLSQASAVDASAATPAGGQSHVRLTEDVVRQELALLREQLQHSQAETAQLAKDNHTLAMIAKQGQADDADRFKMQCDGHAAVVQALRSENECVVAENQRLHEEISVLVAEKKELVGENQSVSRRCEHLTGESLRMKEAAQELREFTNTLRDTLKKYYVANKTLTKKVKYLEATKAHMHETLVRLRSDLRDIQLEPKMLTPDTRVCEEPDRHADNNPVAAVANTMPEQLPTVTGAVSTSQEPTAPVPAVEGGAAATDDTVNLDPMVVPAVSQRSQGDTSQHSLHRVAQALTALRENIEKFTEHSSPSPSEPHIDPNDDTSSESMGDSWRGDLSLSSVSSHVSTQSRTSHRTRHRTSPHHTVVSKVQAWDIGHTAACAEDVGRTHFPEPCNDIASEAHALRSTTHALRKENRALRKKLHRNHRGEVHTGRQRTHVDASDGHLQRKHGHMHHGIGDISNTWDTHPVNCR